MITLLALSGSLRLGSSNTVLLEAAGLLAPAGMQIEPYQGIGTLPHFNPDLDDDNPPETVLDLRRRVGAADGLLISCPEYARGIPGSFKNALDWLVGSFEFPGKAVALFNASPRASDAQAALRLVLTTMSACIVEEASITLPLLATRLDAMGMVEDPEIAASVKAALAAFARTIETSAQAEPEGSG
ncbi:NAD(P)H-dependent oxidoreductase [Labrys sp. LIt4]|uniref:NADPH-dependent FMN reductase n=1 Tax=Labrys sp. LIt4 TaxID=2821355 RepID=UPI001AE02C7D|nr:NADPH-dependent FMN reductase [Labrys sp. LIt4]MBP0582383.1 NAD(P)H-dependent oxidoreductase [Labrys sp. LIt4]